MKGKRKASTNCDVSRRSQWMCSAVYSYIVGNNGPPMFGCMVESDVTVPLAALCNGVDDCGPVGGVVMSGEDEKAAICDSK